MLEAMAATDAIALHAAWTNTNGANKQVFHDFTHGGVEVAVRRIVSNAVEPSYPEAELEYLVGLCVDA